MNDSDNTPSYVVGHVPVGNTKRDWKLDIATEEQYNLAVASGLAWVVYKDFPFSWVECKVELLKVKQEYVHKTREDNYKASCKLEGFEGYKEEE